jgi:hypothetical protein
VREPWDERGRAQTNANLEARVYDGSGLTVRDGARHLAKLLALTPEQAAVLVAELRNAIVPVHYRNATVGTMRVLALADELARCAQEKT